jgi:hypothetical protein
LRRKRLEVTRRGAPPLRVSSGQSASSSSTTAKEFIRQGVDAGDATHLDYALIHPLSRQGSPMAPAEWQGIVEAAGCKEFACDLLGGLVYLYTVHL